MATNVIFFYLHLNQPFKPRCCLETLLNYKYNNEARKANMYVRIKEY